jgi:hypothetical protein
VVPDKGGLDGGARVSLDRRGGHVQGVRLRRGGWRAKLKRRREWGNWAPSRWERERAVDRGSGVKVCQVGVGKILAT